MGCFIILDTIAGIIIFSRINAPWWVYLLLLIGNLIFYLIGSEHGWFDK